MTQFVVAGNVYNVTHYMNFHPGGVEELERGIGKDATKLFSEVHAWVNYDSILKKCLVGRYRPRGSETSATNGNSTDQELGLGMFLASKEEKDKHNASPMKPPMNPKPKKLRWDWYEQEERGSIVLYCKSQEPSVKVTLESNHKNFRIDVIENGDLSSLSFVLENTVSWPVRIIQVPNSSKVEIQLKKSQPVHWKQIGSQCQESELEYCKTNSDRKYSKMEVVDVTRVNHNTNILALSYMGLSLSTTPVGHHVWVHNWFEGQEVERCYTPITKSLIDPQTKEDQTRLYLMVKEYKNGLLSSWLAGRPKGTVVEVSPPEGTFLTNRLCNRKELYLLAAGTGVTPMVGVINWARKVIFNKCTKISFMFFNRTEEDILLRDELDQLAKNDQRFSIIHVLSEADETWLGLRGRISGDMLQSFLPKRSPEDEPKCFAFVCGPTAFTQLTRGLLQVMGYSDEDYHCFLG